MRRLCFGILVALASCGPRQQPPSPTDNESAPLIPAPSAPPAVANSAPAQSTRETSPPEEKAPIDPKSAQAAGEVANHYGALIERGRWTEAAHLWSNPRAAAEFEARLKTKSRVHAEIGSPGDMEGAAGSSYVTVPATFTSDKDRRLETKIILRRVNDVPGSSQAERRWRIERAE